MENSIYESKIEQSKAFVDKMSGSNLYYIVKKNTNIRECYLGIPVIYSSNVTAHENCDDGENVISIKDFNECYGRFMRFDIG